MPIVNGTYQFDTLPAAKAAQKQVFGEYSRGDMSDYSAAAYNYLMQQQANAYNLELWRLQNEYNSPAAQMQRYQDAGLNPNLMYGQSNVAQSPASASSPSFRSGGTMQKGLQAGIQAIGQVMNTVKTARDTWDYWMYGAQGHNLQNQVDEWRAMLLSRQETAQRLANDWQSYLQGRDMDFDPTAPGVRMYQYQMEAKSAQIDQVRQLISASLTGEARTKALKELDSYRLKILQGQNSAVLNIHTGLGDSFDGFLKAMIYLAMSKL